jgi:hypothetical protein
MSELETRLRDLGVALELPQAPDLVAAVEARLATRPAPRRRWRALAAVLAAALAATAALVAFSPGARSALLDLLGIGGVTIQRAEELPDVEEYADLALGRLVTPAEAARVAGFRVRLPATVDGRPVRRVYLDTSIGDGAVSITWPCCAPRVVLTQVRGSGLPWARKLVGPGTTVEDIDVAGVPGAWIEGDQHVFLVEVWGTVVERRSRLAGNVLLWERDGVTFRLEGDLTREQALAIARSVG